MKIMKNKKLHAILHLLWTKAVGTVDYNKKEWLELEAELLELQRQLDWDNTRWGA